MVVLVIRENQTLVALDEAGTDRQFDRPESLKCGDQQMIHHRILLSNCD